MQRLSKGKVDVADVLVSRTAGVFVGLKSEVHHESMGVGEAVVSVELSICRHSHPRILPDKHAPTT